MDLCPKRFTNKPQQISIYATNLLKQLVYSQNNTDGSYLNFA